MSRFIGTRIVLSAKVYRQPVLCSKQRGSTSQGEKRQCAPHQANFSQGAKRIASQTTVELLGSMQDALEKVQVFINELPCRNLLAMRRTCLRKDTEVNGKLLEQALACLSAVRTSTTSVAAEDMTEAETQSLPTSTMHGNQVNEEELLHMSIHANQTGNLGLSAKAVSEDAFALLGTIVPKVLEDDSGYIQFSEELAGLTPEVASTDTSPDAKPPTLRHILHQLSAVIEPEKIPQPGFACPITMDVMHDPVVLETGHTYDRSSIEAWLEQGQATCPLSNQRLRMPVRLVTNLSLRHAIEEWRERECGSARSRFVVDREVVLANGVAARGANAIPALVKMLRARSEAMKAIAARALDELLGSGDSYNGVVTRAGAIPPLVALLHASGADCQEAAAMALAKLAQSKDNRAAIAGAWGASANVDVLHSSGPHVPGSKLLLALMLDQTTADTAFEAGGAAALVHIMGNSPPQQQSAAAMALVKMAASEENLQTLVDAGVVAPLARLMYSSSPFVQMAALDALAVIIGAVRGKLSRLHGSAVVAALVHVLQTGPPGRRALAVAALRHLAQQNPTEVATGIVKAGALPLLVQRQQTASLNEQASLLLKTLVKSLAKCEPDADASSEIVAKLMHLLQDGEPQEQRIAALAVGSMARRAANQVLIEISGGVDLLLRLVRHGTPDVQEAAAVALGILG